MVVAGEHQVVILQ
jgi:hypothetical protein